MAMITQEIQIGIYSSAQKQRKPLSFVISLVSSFRWTFMTLKGNHAQTEQKKNSAKEHCKTSSITQDGVEYVRSQKNALE